MAIKFTLTILRQVFQPKVQPTTLSRAPKRQDFSPEKLL